MAYWLEGVRARPGRRVRTDLHGSEAAALASSRARLRLALVISLVFVAILSFAVFPARRQAIVIDGSEVTVVSRQTDASRLLEIAGVQPEVGDVVLMNGGNLVVDRAIPVLVNVDGRTLSWRTRSRSVEALLSEMGIGVSPYDGVRYNGVEVGLRETLIPEENINLTITRAVPLSIMENGRTITAQSSRPVLSAALADLGISLGPADIISPPPETVVTAGMHVQITHAKAIHLRSGGQLHTIYTQKPTLREALAEIGLVLGEEDRVEPSLGALVTNDMTARLVRVTGQPFYEREPVERTTVFKPDPNLTGTQTRTVQGSDGISVMEYRIVIEDGVEKEKTFVRQFFEPEVVDNVIYYAADAVGQAGIDPGNLNVASTKRVWATWYNAASSGRPASDPAYGITATGVYVVKGIVAVDPTVIPLGTRMFIPGYGFALAADTGGGVKGDWVDLGFPDGVQVDWHTGWVEIYILAP